MYKKTLKAIALRVLSGALDIFGHATEIKKQRVKKSNTNKNRPVEKIEIEKRESGLK